MKATNSVAYGRHTIQYGIVHTARKTIEIAVHPDRSVVVRAPKGADPAMLQQRVHKRAAWILRQQEFFRQFEPRTPPRCYVGGETHLYLGRRYRLKVGCATSASVKLVGAHLRVLCEGESTPAVVEKLVEEWYLSRARLYLPTRFETCWATFAKFGYPQPTLLIRRMACRWGSLSPSGRLTLNTALMRVPRGCIDYVIAHELCHLRHPHHGAAFWKMLASILPDWPRRKQRLEATGS